MSESPENKVQIAALVHLVRLLAAELVAGEHRDDVDKVIQAIDRRISETPLPRGIDVNDAREGFKAVRQMLAPICDGLRVQAANARFSDEAKKQPSALKHVQ